MAYRPKPIAIPIFLFAISALVGWKVKGQYRMVNSPDETRIAFEAHGAGIPSLVFIHGWSCDRTYWREQLPAFREDHRVLALDLAGHGDSGDTRHAWTISAYGSDVAAVVREMDLRDVILIGHSMGGDVAISAAMQLQDRVRGIIMTDSYNALGACRNPAEIDVFIESFRPHFRDSVSSLVKRMFPPGADPGLVEKVAADMSSVSPDIALGSMKFSFGHCPMVVPAIKSLKLPVIAINADYSPTDIRSLEEEGVEVMIMPGVGHFLMLEDPEGFNRILRNAIGRMRER